MRTTASHMAWAVVVAAAVLIGAACAGEGGFVEAEDGALPGVQREPSSSAYVCTDGKRIELYYMRPHDVPDRYAEAQQDIREFFYWAAERLNDRGLELAGKEISIPVKCVNGEPAVDKVESRYAADSIPGSVSSDTALRAEMIEKGLTDPNVKYWFWRDNPKGTGGGRAGMVPMCRKAKDAGGTGDCDDRPGPENWFNRGGSDFYANTWGGDGSGGTMLHEAFHLWGSVQFSAPNATAGGHCTDEKDIMCYSDAPDYPPMRSVCNDAPGSTVDCNADDYFHPAPPKDSYLATHWNPASCANHFLRVEGCTYPFTDPPQPPKPSAQSSAPAAPRARPRTFTPKPTTTLPAAQSTQEAASAEAAPEDHGFAPDSQRGIVVTPDTALAFDHGPQDDAVQDESSGGASVAAYAAAVAAVVVAVAGLMMARRRRRAEPDR